MFEAMLVLAVVFALGGAIVSIPFILGWVLYRAYLAGQALMRKVWSRSPSWHGRSDA